MQLLTSVLCLFVKIIIKLFHQATAGSQKTENLLASSEEKEAYVDNSEN